MSREKQTDDERQLTARDVAAVLSAAGLLLTGAARFSHELRHAAAGVRRRNSHHSRRKERKDMQTVTLYRPVGQKERDLIAESSWRAFPPRLPQQPIFYPVLDESYAVQIARDWNTKDSFSGHVGYVTRFAVRTDFLAHYEVKTVGAADTHREYWIPAEDLPAFNAAIIGDIEVVAEFRGAAPSAV